MAVATAARELKLVRDADGLELDTQPLQGLWTAQQYLKLTEQTNHLIEFTDGVLEILPMPTNKHQAILEFVYVALRVRMQRSGGKARVAVLRVRIREGKFREPDVLLLCDAHDPRLQDAFWLGADLVVEVVSRDNPERDTHEKRGDYAEAGIPEYWIVNLRAQRIEVQTDPAAGGYRQTRQAQRGETLALPGGLSGAVEVSAILGAPGAG